MSSLPSANANPCFNIYAVLWIYFEQVWISYADHLSNPSDVFKFLYKKGIGGQTAMFWIAWAYVAEVQGDYTLAERLYEKAENRKQVTFQI